MTDVAEIIAKFDAALSQYGLAEHAVYYHVQAGCVAAMQSVNSAQQLALAEAAQTAERLAKALEPFDAIREADEPYWQECAGRLRATLELAQSDLSATEIAFRLADQRRFFEQVKAPI